MGLEAVTYISDLVITNPVGGSDPKSEGDDHIRNIKIAIKNTLPNVNGAITATQGELNLLVGKSSGGGTAIAPIPATTICLFQQTSAPTGWTKITSHNDKALRIVSGSVSSGGATGFTSVFGSGKNTGAYTLQTADIPSHTHTATDAGHAHQQRGPDDSTELTNGTLNGLAVGNNASGSQTIRAPLNTVSTSAVATPANTASATASISVSSTGGGGSHQHTLSLDLQYVDAILASKD